MDALRKLGTDIYVPYIILDIFDYLDVADLLRVNQEYTDPDHRLRMQQYVEYYVENCCTLKMDQWVDLYFRAEVDRAYNDHHRNIIRIMEANVTEKLLRHLTRQELIEFNKIFYTFRTLQKSLHRHVADLLLKDELTFTVHESTVIEIDYGYLIAFHESLRDCIHFCYIVDVEEISYELFDHRQYVIALWRENVWKVRDEIAREISIEDRRTRPTDFHFYYFDILPLLQKFLGGGRDRPRVTILNLDCYINPRHVRVFASVLRLFEQYNEAMLIRYNPTKLEDPVNQFFTNNMNHPFVRFVPL